MNAHRSGPSNIKGKPAFLKTLVSQKSITWLWFVWRWTKWIGLMVVFAAGVWALSRPWGTLPAFGVLLDPYNGIWAHRNSIFEESGEPESLRIKVPARGPSTAQTRGPSGALKDSVEIQVDRDQIKHVFAKNDDDLYFAQGYLVASDRLWQMDYITRVASGRLAEIIGRKGLEFDRLFVKLGIPEAARASARAMMEDPLTRPILTAYADGVNAYLEDLDDRDLPFEFKLLGYRPEPWTPLRSALLLKFMAYNLAGRSLDLPLTRSQNRIGIDDFRELFSLDLWIPEPIVPKGTTWSFQSRSPEAPERPFQADIQKLDALPTPHPSNGSNNWAVTGKKSSTGLPIVSNDIHLGFALPSLWYQIQLVSPTQNVYGVTLPGAPGVILGFNSNIAWAVTNGGTDVLDWYQLRFRDEKRSEYLFDGEWRPVISRETQIKIKGQRPETLVLRQTHFGPIVYDETETPPSRLIPRGLAMRWAALDASNELKTFLLLNRASSTEECRKAIETFDTPDQNFLCADNRDDVGIWHMGKYPIRWRGQGRMISDGSSSEYEWKGWIPRDELPFSRNPERGFVSSANQMPTDDQYPHYIGWPFESPFRAMRINEVLRSKAKFSPDEIIAMQNDTVSVQAKILVPALLKAIEGASLDANTSLAKEILSKWDYRFEESSGAGAIFYSWYKAIERRIWSPYFPDPSDYMYPPALKTALLISEEPESKWFDNPITDARETLREVALAALNDAIADVQSRARKSDLSQVKWSDYRKTDFAHVGRIPGLGHKPFAARGMEHTIFANHGHHGPVWKLVVALGPKPRAWGLFPGGQSGDPTSAYYDDFMEFWRRGELKELLYLTSPQDRLQSSQIQKIWKLEAGE